MDERADKAGLGGGFVFQVNWRGCVVNGEELCELSSVVSSLVVLETTDTTEGLRMDLVRLFFVSPGFRLTLLGPRILRSAA